ncbi:MAG: phosphatidylinositol phosphate synthase [Actinomycetota bacterium]
MYPMIQSRFKAPVTKVITPICRGLLRMKVSANALTIFGAIGVSISAIYFFSRDQLFVGTLVVSLFALSDLFDGTMARLSNNQGTKWGALLDSTLDRVSDAAIAIGIWLYFRNADSDFQYLALIVLFLGGLIPYIRARAESLAIECSVGVAERAERLILLLIGTTLAGLGIDIALEAALVLLALLSVVTVLQRMRVVYRA